MKSRNVRKGTADAAQQAATEAFQQKSTLSLNDTHSEPDQLIGRRRLDGGYWISTSRIIPDPEQPRKTFDKASLRELRASIEARGIKTPLTVRWDDELSRYMLIGGERRFRVATELGLTEVPCWIHEEKGWGVLVDQIIENWQRSDLKPYETARALVRLRDEFGMSGKEIVASTGKSKGEVSKLLALVDYVSDNVQELAEHEDNEGKLTKRHLSFYLSSHQRNKSNSQQMSFPTI